MAKAMNLTFGDLIILEISLIHYLRDLDLSMQSGQYISELLGKLEYELATLKEAAGIQLAPGLDPNIGPDGPKK